jgi:hypothetical protein
MAEPRGEGVTVGSAEELLEPARLYSGPEVLAKDSPVPRAAGVYAWYFPVPPPGVPTSNCHDHESMPLLYVGIAPKAPPANGGKSSQQTIQHRLRYHFRGNAAGSTLRLTLGSLLSEQLGIQLRRVGSGNRFTFGTGEAHLSAWMAEHARVAFTLTDRPWELEKRLIREVPLPLNLDQNRHSPFHQTLSELRAAQRARAKDLPIQIRRG